MLRSVLIPLLLATGCATMAPRAHGKGFQLKAFGEAGEAQALTKAFKDKLGESLSAVEPEQAPSLSPDVKVLEGTFPEGVTMRDGMISAAPESGLEVLATFTFSPAFGSTGWFSEYQSTGKRVYCYWQVPFTWATLMMWQIFVPLSWPCLSGKIGLDAGYGYMRQAARAAGADLVILTDVNKDEEHFFFAKGIFLRRTGAAPPSEQQREL